MAFPDHEPFLHIHTLDTVVLELTTRCNLKCSYCTISRPWHIARDLDTGDFAVMVEEMRRACVKRVQISGAGETTILKNWDRYLAALLDAGIEVTIITNLAKPLQERAVQHLSRCVEIHTSCDTVNAEVYASIRAGADLRVFLHNIARIQAAAIIDRRNAPRFVWNCVANDKVILDVVQWVAVGIVLGVSHFQISEMTWLPDLAGAYNVAPIGTMSLGQLEQARQAVDEARRLAESNGRWFTVLPAVKEVLAGNRRVIRSEPLWIEEEGGKTVKVKNRTWVQIQDAPSAELPATTKRESIPPGLTRNCVRPWTEADVWARGAVTPCCFFAEGGSLEGGGLMAAMNSPALVQIRRDLLSGTLPGPCTVCPMEELVAPEVLRARVEALMPKEALASEAVG